MRVTKNTIAVIAIATISIIAVAGAYFTAPIRDVEHVQAVDRQSGQSIYVLDSVPETLSEHTRVDSSATPGQPLPVIASDTVIIPDENGVRGFSPTGNELWSYHRGDRDLCILNTSWNDAVVGFDAGFGCGDIVSLDGATGAYEATRSAPAQENPTTIRSNDRVGIFGPERVELWRSDMVRTVEYGEVEAPQEPDFQPFPECDITSALTRTDFLAVTEACPDGHTQLHVMQATPEDARQPELITTVPVDDGASLVAIGEDSVAVRLSSNELVSYNHNGDEISRADIAPVSIQEPIHSPDLPHHMTWFDGQRLYLLSPEDLSIHHIIEGALGPGAAVGDQLLVPIHEGIGVYNYTTGERDRVISLDRGVNDHSQVIALNVAGDAIIEFRGDHVAFLR